MTVIGIDPGPETSGFVAAVLTGATGSMCSVVNVNKAFPNDSLAGYVEAAATEEGWLIAIETPAAIYGSGVVGASTIDTILFAGALLHMAGDRARRVAPLEVRQHLCGTAKAKDPGVRQALIDRFGEPGTKKAPGQLHGVTSHAWRALAVAVTAYDKENAA